MLAQKLKTLLLGLALLQAVGLSTAQAAATGTPQSQTEALVAAFKKVHVPAEGQALSAADSEGNKTTFTALDAFFSYDKLCAYAIAPHKSMLSKPQLDRYTDTFRNLLRLVSYRRSAQFVQQADVRIDAPKMQGGRALVDMHASVKEEDTQTDVTFVWQRDADTWRIVDVSFDGVSFVKDYQNQFGKMLKKYGAEGFLKKLADRLAQEQKE